MIAVTTTPYGSGSNSQATGTGANGGFGATSTGSNGDGGGSSTGISNPLDSNSKGVPVAAIAGAAAGGFAFVLFLLLVALRYRRHRLRNRPPPPPAILGPGPRLGPGDGPDWSKAELSNTEAKAVSPKSTVPRKPVSVVSPVSPVGRPSALSSPNQRPAEMAVPPAPFRAEVPGGPNAQELHHDVPQYEVSGSHQFPAEMGASLSGPFEMAGDRHW
jgi:hypothetical protein